jgi:hypothetical protein
LKLNKLKLPSVRWRNFADRNGCDSTIRRRARRTPTVTSDTQRKVKRNGEEVSGVAHISSGRVVDFAADALVETVVAGFSYAIEIRA